MNNAAASQPAISDPAQTRRVAALADRRAIRARALSMAGRWLSSAALVAMTLVLVWKFVPSPWIRAIDWWWLIAAPVALAAIPAALALARPVQSRRGALALDETLALRDRLTSAIDLHDRTPPGVDAGFAELAVRRAEALARDVRADAAVPIRVDRAWAVWPSIVVLALGAGVLVRTRPPVAPVVSTASKEEMKQAGEQVRAAAKVIEAIKSEPSLASHDVQRQLDAIADVERELAAGRTLPADARTQSAQALERLAQSLKHNADRELSAQDSLRDSLLNAARATRIDPTKPDDTNNSSTLAGALKRGDLAAAEEAAHDLVEQMPSMSADERAALASELRELANRMARQDAASGGENDASQKNVENATNAEQSAESESNIPSDASRENAETAKSDAANQPEPDESDADHKAESSKPQPDAIAAKPDAANPEDATPNAAKPDNAKSEEKQPAASTRDETKPKETKPNESTPDEHQPDARNPAPTSGTPNERPESKPADARQNKPQEKAASQDKPKTTSAEQRKEQLRRAMEDAARDLSKSDKPRDAKQREVDPNRQSGQPGEQSRESKPGEQQQQPGTRENTTPRENQPKPGDQTSETKHEQQGEKQGERQSEKPGEEGQGKPDQGKTAPSPDSKAPQNAGESNDQKNAGAKPDAGKLESTKTEPSENDLNKPDAVPDGDKSPQPGAPGMQKLADTLREAQEAHENAARDSKLADRLREQAMKTLENASPEQIDKAAEAARELAKRMPKPDPNSVSPDAARKMLEQAEQLMKNATPEQKQKLRDLARKMAEGTPADNNSESGVDDTTQGAARRAAEEFVKNASPEDMKKLSELARSLGLDHSGDRGRGDQPGDGPGRERGTPRQFGDADTKTVDMRDRTNGRAPTAGDRVISDWFDPSSKPGERTSSSRSAAGAEVVRRAAQGAERSIEQQVVPAQQGEYVRRVFRRYLQRAQGGTPTQSTPTSTPATPDAPDSPKK